SRVSRLTPAARRSEFSPGKPRQKKMRNMRHWIENDVLSLRAVDPGCRTMPMVVCEGLFCRFRAGGSESALAESRQPAGTLNPRGEASGSRFRAGRSSFSILEDDERTTRFNNDNDLTTTHKQTTRQAQRCRLSESTADDSDRAEQRGSALRSTTRSWTTRICSS